MTHVGSVNQILRVDRAGEHGAISIYRAQLLVSKALMRGCVPALEEMLEHERRHHQAFEQLLMARGDAPAFAAFVRIVRELGVRVPSMDFRGGIKIDLPDAVLERNRGLVACP